MNNNKKLGKIQKDSASVKPNLQEIKRKDFGLTGKQIIHSNPKSKGMKMEKADPKLLRRLKSIDLKKQSKFNPIISKKEILNNKQIEKTKIVPKTPITLKNFGKVLESRKDSRKVEAVVKLSMKQQDPSAKDPEIKKTIVAIVEKLAKLVRKSLEKLPQVKGGGGGGATALNDNLKLLLFRKAMEKMVEKTKIIPKSLRKSISTKNNRKLMEEKKMTTGPLVTTNNNNKEKTKTVQTPAAVVKKVAVQKLKSFEQLKKQQPAKSVKKVLLKENPKTPANLVKRPLEKTKSIDQKKKMTEIIKSKKREEVIDVLNEKMIKKKNKTSELKNQPKVHKTPEKSAVKKVVTTKPLDHQVKVLKLEKSFEKKPPPLSARPKTLKVAPNSMKLELKPNKMNIKSFKQPIVMADTKEESEDQSAKFKLEKQEEPKRIVPKSLIQLDRKFSQEGCEKPNKSSDLSINTQYKSLYSLLTLSDSKSLEQQKMKNPDQLRKQSDHGREGESVEAIRPDLGLPWWLTTFLKCLEDTEQPQKVSETLVEKKHHDHEQDDDEQQVKSLKNNEKHLGTTRNEPETFKLCSPDSTLDSSLSTDFVVKKTLVVKSSNSQQAEDSPKKKNSLLQDRLNPNDETVGVKDEEIRIRPPQPLVPGLTIGKHGETKKPSMEYNNDQHKSALNNQKTLNNNKKKHGKKLMSLTIKKNKLKVTGEIPEIFGKQQNDPKRQD